MSDRLEDLIALLDLEPIEVNLFRGVSPDEDRQRVFGGQVAGQALVAASRTVDEPERVVHSLHAYFLLPGDPKVPIVYEVDRIRDGKSFSTRRVVAIQHGRPIFNLQASFHDPEPGLDHAIDSPDRTCRTPESLPDHQRAARAPPRSARRLVRPCRARSTCGTCHPTRCSSPASSPTGQLVWMRADGTLPDDPVLHACIVTYFSDMTLLDTVAPAVRPVGAHRRPDDGQPRPCDVVPPPVPRR